MRAYDVVIDGLDPDYVTPATMPHLTGLLKAADTRSTSFGGARAIIASETNPNHVAMMTGAYADGSGFVGNAWLQGGAQTTGEDAAFLEAETVFTAIDRQQPDLVTAAIFGKPKLGRIFATGGSNVAPDYLWIPCSGSPPAGATCGSAPTNPPTGYTFDNFVMDEAIATIDRINPDLLFVNLADVDSAGHGFTPLASVYLAAVARADMLVGQLAAHLRKRGLWDDAVLIVHADHGMDATPGKVRLTEAFQLAGVRGLKVTGNGGLANVNLVDSSAPDAATVLANARAVALSLPGVEEALYRQPNPADGGSAHTVSAAHPDWHYDHPRAGDLVVTAEPLWAFGDTSPSFAFNPLPGNHGGPSTRAVPYLILGGSPLVRDRGTVAPSSLVSEGDDTGANPEQAENVDDAATIAALLGVAPPAGNAGRVLTEALALP